VKDVSLIIYSVADMEKAKQFFNVLIGSAPYADSPYYVGYKSGATEIGLVPSAMNPDQPTLPYWTVDDIAASVNALVNAGGTIVKEITDVSHGLLVASVKDPNGATVGLRQFPAGKPQ